MILVDVTSDRRVILTEFLAWPFLANAESFFLVIVWCQFIHIYFTTFGVILEETYILHFIFVYNSPSAASMSSFNCFQASMLKSIALFATSLERPLISDSLLPRRTEL